MYEVEETGNDGNDTDSDRWNRGAWFDLKGLVCSSSRNPEGDLMRT